MEPRTRCKEIPGRLTCAAVAAALALLAAAPLVAQEPPAPAKAPAPPDARDSAGILRDASPSPLLDRLSRPSTGPVTVQGSEYMEVDPAKRYTLTGWFKSTGKGPSNVYFGFAPFDADKNPITPEQVAFVPHTDGALQAACKKEDTVLRIVQGFQWKTAPNCCVAFETDDSGKWEDLPNRKLTPLGVVKVEEKPDCWEVSLKGPCGYDYPAGTKVREHFTDGTVCLWAAAAGKLAPKEEWTRYSGVVQGVSVAGLSEHRWWRGTRYARMVMILNHGQTEEFVVRVGDIGITAETP